MQLRAIRRWKGSNGRVSWIAVVRTWARCRKRRARGGRWSGPRLGVIGGTTISSFGRRNGGQPVPGRSSRPGGCAGGLRVEHSAHVRHGRMLDVAPAAGARDGEAHVRREALAGARRDHVHDIALAPLRPDGRHALRPDTGMAARFDGMSVSVW